MVPVEPAILSPCSCAAPIFPVKNGSSEMYSKFRPFNGFLWMFNPGPSNVSTRFNRSSSPVISYNWRTSSQLNVHPSSVPFGRENAFVPQSIRIPDGPSDAHSAGILNFLKDGVSPANAAAVPGVTFGLHMPSPRNSIIRSSSDNCATNVSMEIFLSYTSSRR